MIQCRTNVYGINNNVWNIMMITYNSMITLTVLIFTKNQLILIQLFYLL